MILFILNAIFLFSRGFESETDTEEFEKVCQSPVEQQKKSGTPVAIGETQTSLLNQLKPDTCNISTSTDRISTHSIETITEVRLNLKKTNNNNTNDGIGSSYSNNTNLKKSAANLYSQYSMSCNLFNFNSQSPILCENPPKKPPRYHNKILLTKSDINSSSSINPLSSTSLLPSIPEIINPIKKQTTTKFGRSPSTTSSECSSSLETSPDYNNIISGQGHQNHHHHQNHYHHHQKFNSRSIISSNNNSRSNNEQMLSNDEFINSEFYIDESLPSSYDSDHQSIGNESNNILLIADKLETNLLDCDDVDDDKKILTKNHLENSQTVFMLLQVFLINYLSQIL